MGHVKNRDILISSVAATIAAAIMLFARFAMFFGGGRDERGGGGSNPIVLLAMMILAPIAALMVQMAISRSREFIADATGAQIAGTPYGLANALKKIEALKADWLARIHAARRSAVAGDPAAPGQAR